MERWHSYSGDPNSDEVIRRRRATIARIQSGRLVKNRVEYLCELAVGKSVLDIGVVDHTTSATDNPEWLHGNLRRRACRCLGIDILEADIAKLRERGFDVICADVTREPLALKFDLIIGGEVLEHLDAPGMFMKSCSSMLSPGGRLAITVPNPWYANVVAKNLTKYNVFSESADHVAWYEASTLFELGQRYGLELVSATGVGATHATGWKGRVFFAVRPLLLQLGLSAYLFAKSIIYEFVQG